MNKIQQGYTLEAVYSKHKPRREESYSIVLSPLSEAKAELKRPYEQRLYGGLSQKHNQYRSTLPAFADFERTKDKKNIEQRSAKFLSENDPDFLIKGYFLANPSDRPIHCKFIAKRINSLEGILLILDWSRKKGVKESYDSAVDLLSECGRILLKVISNEAITSLVTKDIIAYEEKLEVLIKGIALAHNIPSSERLKAITDLIPGHRRLIKTAIIDALLTLQDEVDSDLLQYYLARFLSTDELDEYVRQYAQEALEEF